MCASEKNAQVNKSHGGGSRNRNDLTAAYLPITRAPQDQQTIVDTRPHSMKWLRMQPLTQLMLREVDCKVNTIHLISSSSILIGHQ